MKPDNQPADPDAMLVKINADAARLRLILADLAHFENELSRMQIGSQPPTVYADKYAQDVRFLLDLVMNLPSPPLPMPAKSELEVALEHDAAGRTERKPKR